MLETTGRRRETNMRLRQSELEELDVPPGRAATYLGAMNAGMAAAEVNTGLRMAHFLSQLLHESGNLRYLRENMNYSEQALLRVFGRYFTPARARDYARQPARIGARVYANRMGNGDEASGDGYRYRGRGFIQLTGRDNYRAFSEFIEDDLLAQPDRVATHYPVDCAVFFWVRNGLNALADLDDVVAVTRRINGGTNGLDHRMQLLAAAKRLLASRSPVTPAPLAPTHRVIATQLNLRSEPQVSPRTLVATLPQGTPVERLGDAGVDGWSEIRTLFDQRMARGVVASRFLQPLVEAAAAPPALPLEPVAEPPLPEAHLSEGRRDVTRIRDGGRAHPLGEAGMPRRNGHLAETLARNLNRIVDYLGSDSPSHLRYRPRSTSTYCNIYAHDYCYLARAYLPRTWWTDTALQRLRAGERVEAAYGNTVRELTANQLLEWLDDHGPGFGWVRVFELDELQAAANNGEVCVIVARRQDLNSPGHIAAVVPETDAVSAERDGAGRVTGPVQSQAGRTNVSRGLSPGRWWTHSRYRDFAFWRHA
jgi:predicted chitinase